MLSDKYIVCEVVGDIDILCTLSNTTEEFITSIETDFPLSCDLVSTNT